MISLLTGVGLVLLLVPALLSGETPPPEAAEAAAVGMEKFLTEIVPPEELVNFGFAPGDDLSVVALGEPWLLYTITPSALRSATAESEIENLITPTGLWYFPVILNGTARCVITVDRMAGKWEAVGIGKAALAAELAKIARQWPKAGGYAPRLVVVRQASAYFFTVPELDPGNLTPLTFDGVGFGGFYQRTLPEYSATAGLGELIGPLKGAVEASIAGHRAVKEGGGE